MKITYLLKCVDYETSEVKSELQTTGRIGSWPIQNSLGGANEHHERSEGTSGCLKELNE